ncbi:MAG: hypothetical protein Q8755_03505, partial [Candidatus Phytoplasma australasiaticum]|nr:hypothetical protein [Candidatus Phytoplasma australasiaticum]
VQQIPLHYADYPGHQRPSNLGIGPSNIPPEDPPRDPMRIVVAKVVRKMKKMSRNQKMLIERNKWLEEMLQQRFNMEKFTTPPPFELEPDSESDLDFDML